MNLYAYCGNDPINRIDRDGLGILNFIAKIYRAVKKVLKWVAIVVAIAVAVVFTFALLSLPGTQFLAGIVFKGLGLLLSFMAKVGVMGFAEGAAGGLTVGLTGQILGAAMTVGAIANHLQQNRQQDKDKDKRPPKERVLIKDVPKKRPLMTCEEHELAVFKAKVEEVKAAAEKHFEEREPPWIAKLLLGIAVGIGGDDKEELGRRPPGASPRTR